MSLASKNKRPTYTATMPVSKRDIKFQPFNVKERRNLLIALEENSEDAIVNALVDMIEDCTFGEVKVDEIPPADAEFMFISIRNKSVGEMLEVYHECSECSTKNMLQLNLENVKVQGGETDLTIQMNDSLWVKMRYPSLKEMVKIPENPNEEQVIDIIAQCMVSVIDGDEVSYVKDYSHEEVLEFLDTLTQEQLNRIEEFFDDIPRLVFEQDYKCKCGHGNTIHIEGIEHFFA